MDRRFLLFAVLVALIFVSNQIVFSLLFPQEKKAPASRRREEAGCQVGPGEKEARPADVRALPMQQPRMPLQRKQPRAPRRRSTRRGTSPERNRPRPWHAWVGRSGRAPFAWR